jgi:multidrug efflux pump subunit AcrA (membrane-fusion protein)
MRRVQAQRLAAERDLAERQAAQRAEESRAQIARAEAERQAAQRAEAARVALAAQQLAQAQAAAARQALAEAQRKAEADAKLAAAPSAMTTMAVLPPRLLDQPAAVIEPVMLAAAELPTTPFFSGATEHVRRFSVGDQFNFRVIDQLTNLQKPLSMQVTAVDLQNDQVLFNNGEYVSDMMGNILSNLVGRSSTPRQFYPADIFVGKRWQTYFKQDRTSGVGTYAFRYDLKVVGKERITVPAGTFDTFKIEARGYNLTLRARLERNIWIAPGVNADIAHETLIRLDNGRLEQKSRQELVSFTQRAPVGSGRVASSN